MGFIVRVLEELVGLEGRELLYLLVCGVVMVFIVVLLVHFGCGEVVFGL